MRYSFERGFLVNLVIGWERKMSDNSKWTSEQIAEFIKFQRIAKERLRIGYNEKDAYSDKPEGFSDWFHETWDDRKKKPIQYTKSFSMIVTCWHCGKTYGGTKCPYCNAYPKRGKL